MKKIVKIMAFAASCVILLSACDDKTVKSDSETENPITETLKEGMYKDDKGNIYNKNGTLFQRADGSKPKVKISGGILVTNNNGTLVDDNGVIIGTISDSGEITYSEAGTSYIENNSESNYDNGDIPENAIECNDSIPECQKLGFGEGTYLPLNSSLSGDSSDVDSAGFAANINQFVIKSDGKTIYFDLDQSQLKKNYIQILKNHAESLLQNEDFRILIEGHADERGSREYNIALSERRAKAVERFLKAEGVLSTQMTTVAYGEERPIDFGHNQAAWAKNRRVVIIYQ